MPTELRIKAGDSGQSRVFLESLPVEMAAFCRGRSSAWRCETGGLQNRFPGDKLKAGFGKCLLSDRIFCEPFVLQPEPSPRSHRQLLRGSRVSMGPRREGRGRGEERKRERAEREGEGGRWG